MRIIFKTSKKHTIRLITLVILMLFSVLPTLLSSQITLAYRRGSAEDYFRNTLCPEILGAENKERCARDNLNNIFKLEDVIEQVVILDETSNQLIPNLNIALCSGGNHAAGPHGGGLSFSHIWNFETGRCVPVPGGPVRYSEGSLTDGSCYSVRSGMYAPGAGIHNHHHLLLLSIGANGKCSELTGRDKTNCEEKAELLNDCMTMVRQKSAELLPSQPDPPSIEINPRQTLDFNDFQEINFYATYIRTVLDSCTRQKKQHCSKVNRAVNTTIDNQSVSINLHDRDRLSTLIGLTAYGSMGFSFEELLNDEEIIGGDKIVFNLPNLMTNTYIKRGLTEAEIDYIKMIERSSGPLSEKSRTGSSSLIFNIDIDVSNALGYDLSDKTALIGAGRYCRVFSPLDYIMSINAVNAKNFNTKPEKHDLMRCRYDEPPISGADKLIKFCSEDSSKCRIFVSHDGLLSSYKTNPMFLQTMYWNIKDHQPLADGYAGPSWKRLSQQERYYMTWVINNPDTSPLIALPAPDEEEESIGDSPIPCDFEGGLGWLLCGGSDFLMRSYDGAYGELENWMTIKPTILDPSKALNDDGEPVMQKNPVKEIWQTMMSIANVLVVFAILVVIISHVTGYGLSNYNIKTMLPKVVIAVILINLSYFIIQLLVEVSNLVGHGVYAIIVNASKVDQINPASIVNLYRLTTDSTNLLTIITFIVGVFLWLITMLLQLLILSGRDAILIITTVTAPIIAILYFLPGSKKLTSLWSKGLMFSLTLFPMTALVYAMGRLGYQLSITSSTDFVSGLVSHTILVLPMIFTPYLAFKLGKGIPVISAGLSKLSTYAMQRASGTYKPKEGSRLWYKQKRLEDIDKQVRAGQYAGLRPIRALKSAIYRRIGDSRILAGSTAQLQTQLAQRHSERAELLTTNDANNIISHYQAIEDALVTQQPAAVPRLQASSAGMAKLMASGGNDKDLIIEAGLAQIKNAITTDDTINIETFAQSLHLARMNGASQDELQAAHREALSYFKGSNNFAATGELKALESYYTDHPNSEGETWGNYDPAMYANRTDSSGNDTEFTTYRKKAIRSDMIHQVLQQPLDEDGKQKSLDAEYMPDGSVAREVFVDEYHNNAEFEAQIRKQSNSFSSETYQSLDNSLNLGLSYDAFSANLTQELVDNINKSKYQLNQTDQINLSRLLRQAGYRNYDAESIRLSNNLHELRAIVNNIRVLTVDERDNIIGHSLKARVPKYNDPAPHLQQRIDISQRSRGKRRGSKNTKRRRS
jgi:hypothetical protein